MCFYIYYYAKVTPFCEITPSTSPGNYCQKILKNKKNNCKRHRKYGIKCENGHAQCILMKDMVISYQ